MDTVLQHPWQSSLQQEESAIELTENITAEYLIVGGGFTGLSTALHLAKLGASDITVVDAKTIGQGASGLNSGMIGPGVWGQYHKMVSKFGRDAAKAMFLHTQEAVDGASALIQSENLDCEFQKGKQFKVALTDTHASGLENEAEALRQDGFNVLSLDKNALRGFINSDRYIAGLCYDNTATVNPFSLTQALKKRLLELDVKIFENTRVLNSDIVHSNTAVTEKGRVQAKKVIICANGYFSSLDILQHKVFPVATRLVISAPLSNEAMSSVGLDKTSAFIDCRNIFGYFRLTQDNRLVMGFGKPFIPARNQQINLRFQGELSLAERRMFHSEFNAIFGDANVDIARAWSGVMGFTIDNIPIISRPKHDNSVIIAGAWCGHGVALSLHNGKRIALMAMSDEDQRQIFPWDRNSCPSVPPGNLLSPALSSYIWGLSAIDKTGLLNHQFKSKLQNTFAQFKII